MQRTLTQIKVAQDEIISGYAENCISDVTSCLSSNNSSNDNYAINACKAQIVTCMSVNGDATATPSPAYIKDWVQKMQSATGTKDENVSNEGTNSQEKYCVSGTGFTATWDDTTQTCTCKGELAFKIYKFVENSGCELATVGGGDIVAPEIGKT